MNGLLQVVILDTKKPLLIKMEVFKALKFEYYYSGALGYYHDITDVIKTRQTNTTTDFLHYTTNDNNSQQSYYYINTSTNSSAQNNFVNYSPFGLYNGKPIASRIIQQWKKMT